MALLVVVAAGACASERNATPPGRVLPPGAARCSLFSDPDLDLVDDPDEGDGDADRDGRSNVDDPDADGDGIDDRTESGDLVCATPPVDSDGDGVPDHLDLDSNDDAASDTEQTLQDVDRDGVPDYADPDLDNDGIENRTEGALARPRADTDADGTPDYLDLDSDGDTILDAFEHAADPDADGEPAFRDLDTDGDGLPDREEAGDGDLATPPRVCLREIGADGVELGDGRPDYADRDSDNDGFGDGEERRLGTDTCDVDSDDDGFDDLAEGTYERVNCPLRSGTAACGCALDPDCGIPPEHFYVVLPFMGPAVERDLVFGTSLRKADVYFLLDTTTSMGGTLANVKSTISSPGGLVERIRAVIPDAWFGGGNHEDFPLGPYGGGDDVAFEPVIVMTDGVNAPALEAAFDPVRIENGADTAESHTEALFQIATGMGGRWTSGGREHPIRAYAGDCFGEGYGAACFREDAVPVVVHFTDACSHNGPPGEDPAACPDYVDISPPPASYGAMTAALADAGVRYLGVNTTTTQCRGMLAPSGELPCYFLRETAEATGMTDARGEPIVLDLPNGSTAASFVDAVSGAIGRLASEVPFDVDTALRDDPSDGVDATTFVTRRTPRCNAVSAEPCWAAPATFAHDAAVASVDVSTFFTVVPQTRVTFRLTFLNTSRPGGAEAQIFVAFIDVRADGRSALETRQVFVVVPATDVVLQ